MPKLDVEALRKAVGENQYFITAHAKERMGARLVSDDEVKRVVTTGDVIEHYPNDQPFPKALFMAHIGSDPLYVSCSFDGTNGYIITVHWYDPSIWIDPWTRRTD